MSCLGRYAWYTQLLTTTSGSNCNVQNAAHSHRTLLGLVRYVPRQAALIVDALKCIGYLHEKGISTKSITLCGHSLGAAVSIVNAGMLKNVVGVAVGAPAVSWCPNSFHSCALFYKPWTGSGVHKDTHAWSCKSALCWFCAMLLVCSSYVPYHRADSRHHPEPGFREGQAADVDQDTAFTCR